MYVMQVLTRNGWGSVGPTGGAPYTYDTAEDARRALNASYPDQCREARLMGDGEYRGVAGVRVVEVD